MHIYIAHVQKLFLLGISPPMNGTPPIAELASRCREETARYLRHEPYTEGYCLDLFRRAVVLRDEDAWAAVYAQYTDIVRRWLDARPGDTDADAHVAAVFARFWHAVDGAKFARFGSLPAVLQYLKMCAHNVRLERGRAAAARAREDSLDDAAYELPSSDDVARAVGALVDAEGFWAAVRAQLPDEREQVVVYLSYVIGLTPREIVARHAARFPTVSEVYRLKRNALDRLRRAPALQAMR